jgi:hypothetical protein
VHITRHGGPLGLAAPAAMPSEECVTAKPK